MAFWGVELKPGKPYIHRYSGDQGRLHLSQATLGTGTSNKKIILQCNVGDKKPIYLCSLLPEKLETCQLNLEFEEDEEVTFSVIGPHSVHLSGFFFGEDEDEDGSDTDDFEGRVIGSDSEDESVDYDSEDEDENEYQFIDDDGDFSMFPSSGRKSGVKIVEIVDDENPANENGISRQTKKKKNQTSKSRDNENSDKQIIINSNSRIPVLESEDEDGFPTSSPSKGGKDADLASKLTSQKESAGEKVNVKGDEDDLGHEKKLKRKIDAVGDDGEKSRGAGQPHNTSTQTNESAPETDTKRKKKNKKKEVTDKEGMAEEADLQKDVVSGDTDVNIQKEEKEKKKKNKKNKNHEISEGTKVEQTNADKKGSLMEMDSKVEAKPFQVRSFPNGLSIEELSMGKPDGKKAAPGKKVAVHYIGKLKNNGKIFDSNIGRAPFKFRLGIGEVIKGWDVGVNGMRVGDKRRLTIPPAMGYGAKGAGKTIPPNSWLVFDVELVDVN